MNDNHQPQMSNLEIEFTQELRGEGSLSLHLIRNQSDAGREPYTKETYIGYDIRPEDLEALYFEGLGVPRWESIEGDNIERKQKIYWEQFNQSLSPYPLIAQVRDTDQKVEYNSDAVAKLREEFAQLLTKISDPKAIKAAQKFTIACDKAAANHAGLALVPSN